MSGGPGPLFAKPAKAAPITAKAILELLRAKHAEDVFVPECKTGPSQGHDHSRFDAWVGLITVSEGGTRLTTSRKAAYRSIADPAQLLRYILMCRTKITTESEVYRGVTREESASQWAAWLAEKSSARDVGHRVSKALGERINGELWEFKMRAADAERKCEDMAGRLSLLANVEHWIAESGLAWKLRDVTSADGFRSVFEEKAGQSAAVLSRELGEVAGRLARLAERLKGSSDAEK